MNTPFKEWEANVEHHPEEFVFGRFHWVDKKTGWKVWIANGFPGYELVSPIDGEIKLSFFDRWRMHKLIKWWVSGALQYGRSQS